MTLYYCQECAKPCDVHQEDVSAEGSPVYIPVSRCCCGDLMDADGKAVSAEAYFDNRAWSEADRQACLLDTWLINAFQEVTA